MRFISTKFDYNASSNAFVAEASDLARADTNIFHRIYPDSCDEGITVISDRTGNEADFYVDHTDTSPEGEVQGWRLLPTPEAIKQNPGLRSASLLIIND